VVKERYGNTKVEKFKIAGFYNIKYLQPYIMLSTSTQITQISRWVVSTNHWLITGIDMMKKKKKI